MDTEENVGRALGQKVTVCTRGKEGPSSMGKNMNKEKYEFIWCTAHMTNWVEKGTVIHVRLI
jgi:hypothetical protein